MLGKFKSGELLISGGMALLAVVFYIRGNFVQTVNPDDPGPGFFPRSLSVLLFAASVAQFLRSWRKTEEKRDTPAGVPEGSRFSFLMLLGTMLLSILYGLVFDKVSYVVTTTCFLGAMMFLGGVRKWHVLLCVAIAYSVATYYLFGKVLMVPLK